MCEERYSIDMTNQMINIREIRNEQGLKLEYVAKKVGMSIPYLSQLERNKRTISYSDYVNILDVLGYEIKIQKKNVVGELRMSNEIIKANNMLGKDDIQEIEGAKLTVLSNESKIASEKIMDILKKSEQEKSMLIKVFQYALKYKGDVEESLIRSLSLLCEKDKELLGVLNENLEKVIALGNKSIEDWSKEEHDWYLIWNKFDWAIYEIGADKRMKKFNMTAEEDHYYGDPVTVREYILKNGTPISVMYWLNGQVAEYSYDLRTEKDGIYAIKEKINLIRISDDREIDIIDEEIIKQLSDKDKQEVIRIMEEAYDFEELFSAQLRVAFELMQVTRTVVMDIYKTQEHPDRYTDEYKEDIKQFYM